MGRDAERDRGDDEAAWCDLVARLGLPSAVDPANPPWPDRENLRPAAHRRTESRATDQPAGRHDDARAESAAGKATDPDRQPDCGGDSSPGADSGQAGRTHAAGRGRVIRPARPVRFPVPAEEQAPGSAAPLRGPGDLPWMRGFPAAGGLAAGWSLFGAASGPAGELTPVDAGGSASPDADRLDWEDLDENADERYVPPHVPPQPKLDPVARGAWTALFGGPGYLFIATTFEWQVPGWAELAAIIAFITGFVVLVSRLGDGPSRRDGPDQGAVV